MQLTAIPLPCMLALLEHASKWRKPHRSIELVINCNRQSDQNSYVLSRTG